MIDPEKCPRCGVTELGYNMRKVSFFCAECDWQERLYTESEIAAAELRAARVVLEEIRDDLMDYVDYENEGRRVPGYLPASIATFFDRDDSALREIIDRDREKVEAVVPKAGSNLGQAKAGSAPASLLPALRAIQRAVLDLPSDRPGLQIGTYIAHGHGPYVDSALLELVGSARESSPPSDSWPLRQVHHPHLPPGGMAKTSGDPPTPTLSRPRIGAPGHCGICGVPYTVYTTDRGVPVDWVPQCQCWKGARAAEPAERPFPERDLLILLGAAKRAALLEAARELRGMTTITSVDECADWLESKAKEGG